MHAFLHVISGPDQGKRLQVSDAFATLIGRSRHSTAPLRDANISRIHCEVEIRNGRIVLTDLDSRTGTFVNGKRVAECVLRLGDLVQVGQTKMCLDDVSTEADTAVAVAAPVRPVLRSREQLPQLSGNRLSHFDVGEVVARGQSGLVFQAYDLKYEREVALKVLWPEATANEEEMQRFVRAMRTMMPLAHPNLVRLLGAGRTGPYCWVAMEFVEGESLTQLIARLGTANMLDWRKVLRIGNALAQGLEYAHERGIIHRNLTPQNILVGRKPADSKIGDMMLAKALDGPLAEQLTRPGEVLGDVRYTPPERAGDAPLDERSDLYSLGALMYTMLAGRPPFDGVNVVDTMMQICRNEPAKLDQFQMGIPGQLADVVYKLLSKRPEDRFESATKLLGALQKVAKWQNVDL